MDSIATRIGRVLASELDDSLRRPMSWKMIDALAKLDEAEERAAKRPKPLAS